ncbi:MAG: RNA recognition motif domain-containing protein [Bacteroidota bacterium]
MTNIFIANLDFGITSDDLKTTFSQFGDVSYAHVVYDSDTKRSKGYGYIEMEDNTEALNAIEALNGFEVKGRKLDVKIATPKGDRKNSSSAKRDRPSERSKSAPKKVVRDANVVKRRVLRPRKKRNKDD